MSVFDAFNETVNDFFDKIYSESNKESLKKWIDDGKATKDCVVIMNGEHKPCKRVFDKLNIPVLFNDCMETDKALIVTDKETVLWFGNSKDHITFMFYLWSCFPADSKPEWVTFGDLMYYEKEILKE